MAVFAENISSLDRHYLVTIKVIVVEVGFAGKKRPEIPYTRACGIVTIMLEISR